jgi:YidC/Oxa1 family membrane protein insertase
MSFFEIIIDPFIYIIESIFLLSYSLTGNYGLSIILLSFGISLLLLPIFIIIEKAKKKDDAIKLKMKPLVDEIKRCYKGQERYYYLKTLNRQNNYSPLRALIPILSLLLQIPFFIAAYQYLENFEPLKGVSFGFIKDLSTPDGLFGSVHFLPIAMTIVNLITAYFYTRNGNTSERKQMLVVAGIFLVLLFNLPSGLVLYWTMNNVFSFFRLFITNPEVFKKREHQRTESLLNFTVLKSRFLQILPRLNRTFLFIVILAILSQLNWAFQHSFDDFFLRIFISILASIVISLLMGILIILHKVDLDLRQKGIKEVFIQLWPIFKPLFIVLAIVAVLTQVNWAIQHNFDSILQRLLISVFGGTFITLVLAFVIIIYQLNSVKNKLKIDLLFLSKKKVFSILFVVLSCFAIISQINWSIHHNFKEIVPRASVAVLIIWFLIYITSSIFDRIAKAPKLTVSKFWKHINNKKQNALWIFITIAIISVAAQINCGVQHNFDSFLIRALLSVVTSFLFVSIALFLYTSTILLQLIQMKIKVKQGLFFSLLFLSIYFYLASIFYYKGVNTDLSFVSLIAVVLAQIVGYYFVLKSKKFIKKWILFSIVSLLFVFLVLQILAYGALPENISGMLGILQSKFFGGYNRINISAFAGFVFALLTIPFLRINTKEKKEYKFKPNWLIYTLAIFYLVGFIFLWNPLSIYASSPATFVFPAFVILKKNFFLFFISIAILTLVYFILPKRIKLYWLLFILLLTIISFINNTIVPIKVGTLQEYIFTKQDNLEQPIVNYLIEGIVILIIISCIKWILRKNRIKEIVFGLLALNAILIFQSLLVSISTGDFLKKAEIKNNANSSITFSKDKENIVFFIADMFHGWYIDKIIKEEPELKEELDGFVWYPNTLSVSSITCSSLGPILGGFDHTPEKQNLDKERTNEQKITDIVDSLYKKIKSKDYKFTASHFYYSKFDMNNVDTYIPSWHKDWDAWNSKLSIGLSKEIWFTLLWENAMFYSTPLFLKPIVYNEGDWLHDEVTTNENTTLAKRYNFLRLLPDISDTTSVESSFIYIHSLASHHTWDIIDENGVLHPNLTPYENNKWVLVKLIKWINWMKENDVYDNTKIILLSDHGPHWMHFKGGTDLDIPIVRNPELNVQDDFTLSLFALLMVKDFKKEGAMHTDWRFMSNADAMSIAFNEDDPTKKDPPLSRTLPSTIVNWTRKLGEEKQLKIVHQFEVQDSIFDLRKWKKLNN